MNHHNEALFSTKILFTTKYTVNALPIFVDNYLTSYTYTIVINILKIIIKNRLRVLFWKVYNA